METPSKTATETVESTEQNKSNSGAAPENATEPTSSQGADPTEESKKTPRAKKAKLKLTSEMLSDPVSQKMFFYAKLFAVLALVCIGYLTALYLKKAKDNRPHPVVVAASGPKIFKFEKEMIHVVLSNKQELRVVIVFDCNSKAACDYLKDHHEKINDLLVPFLNSIDPLILKDAQTKKLLRQKMVDQLNNLIPEGEIIEANFTELSLEGNS